MVWRRGYAWYSLACIKLLALLIMQYIDRFLESARQLEKALETPLITDIGYAKRYLRCLQVFSFATW